MRSPKFSSQSAQSSIAICTILNSPLWWLGDHKNSRRVAWWFHKAGHLMARLHWSCLVCCFCFCCCCSWYTLFVLCFSNSELLCFWMSIICFHHSFAQVWRSKTIGSFGGSKPTIRYLKHQSLSNQFYLKHQSPSNQFLVIVWGEGRELWDVLEEQNAERNINFCFAIQIFILDNDD